LQYRLFRARHGYSSHLDGPGAVLTFSLALDVVKIIKDFKDKEGRAFQRPFRRNGNLQPLARQRG
jgi:hypothetical protein